MSEANAGPCALLPDFASPIRATDECSVFVDALAPKAAYAKFCTAMRGQWNRYDFVCAQSVYGKTPHNRAELFYRRADFCDQRTVSCANSPPPTRMTL